MIQDLVTEGARAGNLRDDIAPGELATYCLHALTAAGTLPSKAAVRRLVTVTLAGMRPDETPSDATGSRRRPRHSPGTSDSSPDDPPHDPHHHGPRSHRGAS